VCVPVVAWGDDGDADAQDEYSVGEWMEKNRMPKRISDELFVAMAKALDFIDPDKLSMTVVLTAMNRFLNETDGSQTAFLDGNQPERLCRPMQVRRAPCLDSSLSLSLSRES
jgi:15-cis-phytoene desaturase